MKQKFIVEVAITINYDEIAPTKKQVGGAVEIALEEFLALGTEEIRVRKVDFD